VSGSAFGPWPAASGQNWPMRGGSRRPAARPSRGSPAARVLQGRGRGHRGGGEGAPGKKIGGGAHPIGGASGGGGQWCGAVAVDGGGAGTVVTDDGALALHHGDGESEVSWG
jgi:hypothetical protein